MHGRVSDLRESQKSFTSGNTGVAARQRYWSNVTMSVGFNKLKRFEVF